LRHGRKFLIVILTANTGDEKLSAMSQIEALILIANTGDEKLSDPKIEFGLDP
jgi:hypothetical protein